MSQPVKLSDALVLDARVAGKATERSIAGQVQFWANLGRAIEPLLQGNHVLALIHNGDAKPLSACIESVDSAEGRPACRTIFDPAHILTMRLRLTRRACWSASTPMGGAPSVASSTAFLRRSR